jgi:ubiquinone/menaquinone biosynthesis C-methylase UbiE
MSDRIKRAIQSGWDRMSDSYQAETRISLDDVHYGPLCPGERDLRLLGDVRGKNVLELACGAAQNSIALSKWGARVTALDSSPSQLSKARTLIVREAADVGLVRGDAERLGMFRDGRFDLVLSSFGWEFIPDLALCFRECARLLRANGLLAVCTVHPLAAFEWDEKERGLIVTDYFNPPVEVWEEQPDVDGQTGLTFFHTIEEMFGLLVASGFRVERIVEPFPHHPEDIARGEAVAPYTSSFWEGQYERLSRVPFSLVYVARKR